MPGNRSPFDVLWALALIFLIAVPVALPYGSQIVAQPSSRQLIKDEWDVYGNEVVTNQTIILTGNLTITLGAHLTLKDSTLNLNLTSDKQYNILVEDGGKLILDNTVIKSNTPGHRFRFDVINATMTADKSTSSANKRSFHFELILLLTFINFFQSRQMPTTKKI